MAQLADRLNQELPAPPTTGTSPSTKSEANSLQRRLTVKSKWNKVVLKLSNMNADSRTAATAAKIQRVETAPARNSFSVASAAALGSRVDQGPTGDETVIRRVPTNRSDTAIPPVVAAQEHGVVTFTATQQPVPYENGTKQIEVTAEIVKETTTVAQEEVDMRTQQEREQLQHQHTEAYDELLSIIETLRRENADLQGMVTTASAELNRLQSEAFYKVDDSHLIGQVENLRYMIRNWSITYFKPCDFEFSIESFPGIFRDVTSTPEDFITSEKHRPLFMQAYLWRMIETFVFDNYEYGLLWMGPQDKALRNVRALLIPAGGLGQASEEETREYMAWRARTSTMIIRRYTLEVANDRLWTIVNKAEADITRYASHAGSHFRAELFTIFRKALELDADIQRQRARFSLTYHDRNGYGRDKFDASTMDLVPEGKLKKGYVTLKVAPALMKGGSSDGHSYHKPALRLAKMLVSCEEPSSQFKSWLKG